MPDRKIYLVSQERFPADIVPITSSRRVNKTFADAFEDDSVPTDTKLRTVLDIITWPAINGITRRDLKAALKWLFELNYDYTRG